MRYKIILEYFGKNYSGWQRQKNAISVQSVLEDSLSSLLQQKITVVGSGRTDKGVHAMGQVAHFDADTTLSPFKIIGGTNNFLPWDIRVVDCEVVSDDFHAQFDATRKTYIYKLYRSNVERPLKEEHYVRVLTRLNLDIMKEGGKKLVGEHDFAAFSSAKRLVLTTVREIYRLDIREEDENIIFEIEGNGFLYNMVRIIVGTLVYIGLFKIPLENIDLMLKTGSRKLGGMTFPAKGLYLKEVFYK